MVRKVKKSVWLLVVAVVVSACSLMQAIALKDCRYTYAKMTDVSFLGMTSADMLTLTGPARLAVGLLGKSDAPLDFTIHLNVYNPNQTTAAMEALYYRVLLDSVQVTEGSMKESFMVVGGATEDLPLKISVDMKALLHSDNRPVITRAIKNIIGLNADPTNVTVLLKPTVRMGSSLVTSPVFIPVNFTYTGKKAKNEEQ